MLVVRYQEWTPVEEVMLIEIERQNDVCVLRIQGRFLTGTDPEYLRAKTDEIKQGNYGKVLVDLREVSSIGSSGIGFLVGIYTSITRNPEGRFVLVGPNRRVWEVLDLTHLNTVLPIAADVASGMAALGAADRAARSAEKK